MTKLALHSVHSSILLVCLDIDKSNIGPLTYYQSTQTVQLSCFTKLHFWALVVTQLAERSLLTQKNTGSNPSTSNVYIKHSFTICWKDTKRKIKRPWIAHILLKITSLLSHAPFTAVALPNVLPSTHQHTNEATLVDDVITTFIATRVRIIQTHLHTCIWNQYIDLY